MTKGQIRYVLYSPSLGGYFRYIGGEDENRAAEWANGLGTAKKWKSRDETPHAAEAWLNWLSGGRGTRSRSTTTDRPARRGYTPVTDAKLVKVWVPRNGSPEVMAD